LNPYVRLAFGLLACLCVVAGGIGIAFISNPFGQVFKLDQPQIPFFLLGKLRHIWVLADLFALLWILGLINFVNWSKGVDGQLPGIVVIAAITIGISSFRYSADITQWPVAVLSFLTAGAFAGFLPFNFYPQKIMPGYGAGAIAGFMLAVLSILATAKVGTLFMVLGIPLIDACFVMIQRILKGKSPVWGDDQHLHHKLLKLGWGKRRIAIFYWIVTLTLGILALRLSPQGKLYTIIILILILGAFFLWDKRSAISLFRQDPDNGSKT
jgi:UDP-GlcNAc:undecaprenyl-phosphate GlcNAc-1-phosphate transferase